MHIWSQFARVQLLEQIRWAHPRTWNGPENHILAWLHLQGVWKVSALSFTLKAPGGIFKSKWDVWVVVAWVLEQWSTLLVLMLLRSCSEILNWSKSFVEACLMRWLNYLCRRVRFVGRRHWCIAGHMQEYDWNTNLYWEQELIKKCKFWCFCSTCYFYIMLNFFAFVSL